MESDPELVQQALRLFEIEPGYIRDAREGAAICNSIVGSLISQRLGVSRSSAEAATAEAVRRLDAGVEVGSPEKRFSATFSLESPQFQAAYTAGAIADILRVIGGHVVTGRWSGTIADRQGQPIGTWNTTWRDDPAPADAPRPRTRRKPSIPQS